ncbi:MAG: sulfur carrier protein ThiS [Gammaproteobacteria bacterium]|nr:sulfur carrier protein ThiS [Gammaproteobacteria bacterium]
MKAFINGEEREFDSAPSILDLVRAEGLEGRRIAIELNGDIVPRSQHAETTIAEGDRVEIVHAIGGG